MRIQTNMADQRKLLAQAIGEWIHESVVYEGVPSCAYRVGTVRVERGGVITSEDSEAWETLRPFFQNHGWAEEPAEEATDDSEAQTEQTAAIEDEEPATELPDDSEALTDTNLPERVEFSVPANDITMDALKNLTFMLRSKQRLLNRSAGVEFLSIPDVLIQKLKEYRPTDLGAFGALLEEHEVKGFAVIENKLAMIFPYDALRPDRWTVYANLFARAVKAAKRATRVSPEETIPESEKYAMRSWLLRLGYGDADLKAERKALLKNLTGFTAFRNDDEMRKHKEKYAAIRAEKRQTGRENDHE